MPNVKRCKTGRCSAPFISLYSGSTSGTHLSCPTYFIQLLGLKVSLIKKLLIIQGSFEIIGIVQFLGNELFLRLMPDSDYRLLVPAEMMDGEVIPHRKVQSIDQLGNFIF